MQVNTCIKRNNKDDALHKQPSITKQGKEMNEMGLSIRLIERREVDAVHTSYSGFHAFRTMVARMTRQFKQYQSGYCIDEGKPFEELLNHMDSEGTLEYSECQELLEDFKKYEEQFKKLCTTEENDWMPEYYGRLMEIMEQRIRPTDNDYEIEFA